MAEETPKSPENPLKAEVCECTRPGPFTRDNVCTKCEKPYLKSPENSGEAEPKKYVSKCLVCGYPHSDHLIEDLGKHIYPYLPVTEADLAMWRKAGDSEQAIMSRCASRGMAE
jgi:hypothetical protein